MKREWKPGDVADWQGMRVFRDEYGVADNGPRWISATEGEAYPTPDSLRPLVVIDPENREQVERLQVAYSTNEDRIPYSVEDGDAARIDAMRAALQSLTEPDRPEEPTGLGAVVEGEDGHRYVRLGPSTSGEVWIGPDDADYSYDAIKAVRILSPGVPS